jgi:hypothetical protein
MALPLGNFNTKDMKGKRHEELEELRTQSENTCGISGINRVNALCVLNSL